MGTPYMDEARSRRHLLHGLVIAASATLLRWAWAWATSQGPGEIQADAVDYFTGARSLLETGEYRGEWGRRALHMPLYPAFLAAVFSLTGPSVAAAQAAQGLVGGLACAALYWGASACLSPGAALFAGWSAAAYWGLVYPSGRMLTECLYSSLLCALFTGWLRWPAKGSLPLMGGAAAGLYLTRPDGLFAAGVLALSAPGRHPSWKARHSLILVAPMLLAAGLWSLRNLRVLGVLNPGTTNSGFTLWFALPRTIEERLGLPTPPRPPEDVPELERDRAWRERAFKALRAAGPVLLMKAAAFNLATLYYPFLPRYELTYMLLLPLWLYACFRLEDNPELRPAAGLVAAWTVLFTFVGGADSRFRQLFAPLLILLAAAGFDDLAGRMPVPRLARLLGFWAGGNLVVFAFSDTLRRLALVVRDLLW